MKQLYLIMTASALLTAASGRAQDNPLLDAYRAQVEAYSPDLRAAEYAAGASGEARQSARADFLPKLSGGANFNYTGHPLRKDIALPGTDDVYTFEGRNTKYGASVSLAQPLYAGGALRAGYDKAQAEDEMARQEIKRVTNDLRHEADVRYWNHVAQCELVSVADGYRQSVGRLVEVVRQRVEAEYTDRNDLLMAEVRLNDADYQVQRARNDAEVARLSLNALAGIPSDQYIATDTLVVPLTVVQPLTDEVDDLLMRRPEMGMAEGNVRVQQSAARQDNARTPAICLRFPSAWTAATRRPAMTSVPTSIPIMPSMPSSAFPSSSGANAAARRIWGAIRWILPANGVYRWATACGWKWRRLSATMHRPWSRCGSPKVRCARRPRARSWPWTNTEREASRLSRSSMRSFSIWKPARTISVRN